MAGFFVRRFFTICSLRQVSSVKKLCSKTILDNGIKHKINHYFLRRGSSYEADGKTIGFIINKKTAEILCIESVRTEGFGMANGEEIFGSIILFPHSILSWHVQRAEDISEESLTLFKVLEPKIDILILGYGKKGDYTPEIRERFTKICKKFGIPFEALPTEQACGIFNFLASELRLVGGAFIPPSEIDELKLHRRKEIDIDSLNDNEDELDQRLALENKKPDTEFLK